MKTFYLMFACGNALIAALRLYRAYTGNMPGGLVTFSNSGAATLGKKQRRTNAAFGICYLVFAIGYLFIASLRYT